jgi:hypothetical protein
MGTKNKTFKKSEFPFDPGIPDTAVVTTGELARALRVSRWTIRHWCENLGYKFQFGSRTTPAHAKSWMEANSELLKGKTRSPKEEDQRRKAVLAELK